MTNQISIHKLTNDFYNEHTHLQEVLDKDRETNVFTDKGRGYGVILVDVKGYKFAIPLRSHMTHKDNFAYEKTTVNGKTKRKGLDYSKAVIITDPKFVSSSSYFIKQDQFLDMVKAQHHIIKKFEKYVDDYIAAVKSKDKNKLKRFAYTTLKNYHDELGI